MESRSPEGVIAAVRLSASSLGYSTLKPLQEEVIVQFVAGRDVFAVLPTGFGKSLCYACLLQALDRLREKSGSFVIVVTPLLAIMRDQVASFSSKGLWAAYVAV